MDKLKIYVVGNAYYYRQAILNSILVKTMEEADIVLFTGGEDVDPSLYREEKHYTTYSNINRDVFEKEEYEKSLQYHNLLRFSICRGSQLMTVLNGGKLVQNVHNHGLGGTHEIITNLGEKYQITSTHHQMMYPYNLNKEDYELLAIASPSRSNIYEGSGLDWQPEYGEPEIVYYSKTNTLCVQGHPEYMGDDAPVVIYINKLINQYLNHK